MARQYRLRYKALCYPCLAGLRVAGELARRVPGTRGLGVQARRLHADELNEDSSYMKNLLRAALQTRPPHKRRV